MTRHELLRTCAHEQASAQALLRTARSARSRSVALAELAFTTKARSVQARQVSTLVRHISMLLRLGVALDAPYGSPADVAVEPPRGWGS